MSDHAGRMFQANIRRRGWEALKIIALSGIVSAQEATHVQESTIAHHCGTLVARTSGTLNLEMVTHSSVSRIQHMRVLGIGPNGVIYVCSGADNSILQLDESAGLVERRWSLHNEPGTIDSLLGSARITSLADAHAVIISAASSSGKLRNHSLFLLPDGELYLVQKPNQEQGYRLGKETELSSLPLSGLVMCAQALPPSDWFYDHGLLHCPSSGAPCVEVLRDERFPMGRVMAWAETSAEYGITIVAKRRPVLCSGDYLLIGLRPPGRDRVVELIIPATNGLQHSGLAIYGAARWKHIVIITSNAGVFLCNLLSDSYYVFDVGAIGAQDVWITPAGRAYFWQTDSSFVRRYELATMGPL